MGPCRLPQLSVRVSGTPPELSERFNSHRRGKVRAAGPAAAPMNDGRLRCADKPDRGYRPRAALGQLGLS